ncbi:MAG: M56 family metallopeptidase [bacterium]|nr:M56 family metallopeptidase [bacterium]
MLGSVMWDVLRVHVLQFTLVLLMLSLLSWWTSKRWPQVSFLLLILALLKCLVPPVIPNPLGVFSWHPQLALQAENLSTNRLQLLRAEKEQQRQSQLWRTWLQSHALQPELAGPAPRLARSGWLKVTGQVLLAVWGTGTLLLLLGTLRQFWKLNLQIQRTSRTPPAWLVRRVHELKASLGIRKHVNIRVSEANLGPGCIGLIKPTLVIPRSMVDLMPERCWQPILAHELIHLRRRDVLWGYLQYAVQILWWFHPLVWWLGKRLSLTCERCVDQQVLSSLQCTPTAYGESLVRVLQLKRVMRPLPTGQHLSAAEVTSHRLRSLRNYPQRSSRRSALAAWCLFFAGTCAILPGTSTDGTPTDSVAHQDLRESREAILACVHSQDWKSAEKLLQAIISTRGSTSEAHILLGHVFMQQKKFKAAESQFLEACTQATSMPFALYQ